MILTLKDYWMGRDSTHASDLTPEIRKNAVRLIERVNNLLSQMKGITFELHPRTKSLISSGWRPFAINVSIPNAASKSHHIRGNAVDLYDPAEAIDNWCMQNLHLLEQNHLWLEHPSITKGWCHLQQLPPASKQRVFFVKK